MIDLELVEKLRGRANVTYDEAKEALESCEGDILEAVIFLEKKGKVPPPSGGSYTSRQADKGEKYRGGSGGTPNNVKFSAYVKSFFSWLGCMIKKGCVNMFEVWRYDKILLSAPVIVLVALFICCFWLVTPLMIVGLFFDCRYKFKGSETENSGLNNVIDSIANAADSLKNEMNKNE